MPDEHDIADVSRISGIPKDLLRQWERRYKYPRPARDGNGDRVYSNDQLNKLVLIRQLIDQGKRPGKLMSLDLQQLKTLQQEPVAELDTARLLELLRKGDAGALRDWLQKQLVAHGLRAFIHRLMVPAIRAVGDAWSGGNLAIYEEHLFTEMLNGLVRQSLVEQYAGAGKPRVMLTTVQGEQHSLGLLMVEALLRLGGAEVIAFGTEMPFSDIREAAVDHEVDVIGLSFSSGFKTEDAIVMLTGLRQMIVPGIRIWVGGGAFHGGIDLPEGVRLLDGLHEVEQAVQAWQ